MLHRISWLAVGILVVLNIALLYAVFARNTSDSRPPTIAQPVATRTVFPSSTPARTQSNPTKTAAHEATKTPSRTLTTPATPSPTVPLGRNLITPSARASTSPGARIELTTLSYLARPFETVPISGTYHGPSTTLRTEQRHGDRWSRFPLPAITDKAGRFTAYVELGQHGRHELRVVDPATNARSAVVTVVIG